MRKRRPSPVHVLSVKSSTSKARSGPVFTLWSDASICLGLVAGVLLVYLQVRAFDFVTLDDPVYVTANPHVQAGLSWAGIVWAFSSEFGGQWHPVTWLSHMLDCQLFGLDSGWHHLTNVAIHALSALAWFGALTFFTGERWKSAFVALLFALHPLHVESVAWVCERKDVLSCLFCALTLWAYAKYASRPSWGFYLLAVILYCLGLMAKPMLVTLPAVLLLLDWWPFQRGFRLLEKLPFLAASAAVSIVTVVVHQHDSALPSIELLPIALRFENALVSYIAYIGDMFWPVNLAVFYPYGSPSLVLPAIFAGLALAGITTAVFLLRRPYLAFGWFWYLVTLVPVIGLLQAGAQARADRFTYLPMIGLSVALVWGASEALTGWPRVRVALMVLVCLVCIALSWIQVGYWRDSISLYRHAIAVTSENPVMRFNLASALETKGDSDAAIVELRETVRIRPHFASAHAELGQLLAKQGRSAEALVELQTAVSLRPDNPDAHFRLGSVLGTLGQNAAAAAEFLRVIEIQPANADAHYNLGFALGSAGKLQEAAREFSEAARLSPDDAIVRFNLGITLARLKRFPEAATQFQEAVRIKPDFAEARQALEDAKNPK